MIRRYNILALCTAIFAFASPVVAHASIPSWSAPARIGNGYSLTSVSCTSASFCIAVGFFYDNATTGEGKSSAFIYNGSSWSEPVTIANFTNYDYLESVSCVSSSFCAAVGSHSGISYIYDGNSWSASESSGAVLKSVSCASSSFCVAVGYSDLTNNSIAVTYNGNRWSAPASIASERHYIESVSCPTTSFCIAISSVGEDGYSNAVTYDGTSWGAPVRTGPFAIFPDISCPTVSFCVAVGPDGNEAAYSGGSWSVPASIDPINVLAVGSNVSVSCASTSFCVAVNFEGNAVTYDGSSWNAPTSIYEEDGIVSTSASCPLSSFCVVVNGDGNAVTYSGSPGEASSTSPSNAGPPNISGSARVWGILSCNPGSWSGSPTPTLSYQWRRDSVSIGGATGSKYTIEAADVGHALTCVVTAGNGVGRASATSAAVHIPVSGGSGSSCPDVVIFGARGSGEDNTAANVGMGPVPYLVAQEIRNLLPIGLRVGMIGVNYPAVGPLGALANGSDYLNSVSTGAQVLVEGYNGQVGLVSMVLSCPRVAVVLVGLSQGSHVIHYAMSLAPAQPSAVTRHIVAVLLFGDPVRQPQESYNIGDQDAQGVLFGLGPLPGNTGPPSIVSYLEPATQSYCLPKDPICDYTGLGDLAENRGIHDGYGSSSYIAAAAAFAVRHIRAAVTARATAAAVTGARATVAHASRARRKHARHRCVSHQTGLYDAVSVCPHVVHGTRPQRNSIYRGVSRNGDRVAMKVGGNAASVSVKVVDRCGAVFTGSVTVSRGGVFDGTNPEGFELIGRFVNRRTVRGTLTDPSCRSLPIRDFTLRRQRH